MFYVEIFQAFFVSVSVQIEIFLNNIDRKFNHLIKKTVILHILLEQMIILLYLTVIFGWALLILVIKCRKAREKRIALAQQEGTHYENVLGRADIFIWSHVSAQTQNAVHVIQIGNSFYDVIPITNPSSTRCHHNCRRGYQIRHSTSNSSLNAHTNPTFVLDEGIYPSGKLIAFY